MNEALKVVVLGAVTGFAESEYQVKRVSEIANEISWEVHNSNKKMLPKIMKQLKEEGLIERGFLWRDEDRMEVCGSGYWRTQKGERFIRDNMLKGIYHED